MKQFIFQIACQTWFALSDAERTELESNDFTFTDFLGELSLAVS